MANREALWEWTSAWVEGKLEASKPADPVEAAEVCEDEECGLPSD